MAASGPEGLRGAPIRQAAACSSPASIYLNNAAEGWPKAPGVAQAVHESLEQPPSSAGRVAGSGAGSAAECRRRIAGLLAVPDPRRIVLTTSATHALNLAIHGVGLQDRAVVITTVTEHNSVLRPLFRLEREGRARIITIGLNADGGLDGEAFERALSGRPRLVAINHASNVTGRIHSVERLFAWAKDAGAVTLLDASQTVGHVPVLPWQLGADIVAFPGHKGLHGPSGTGALYVAPHVELAPLIVGGTGYQSQSRQHPEKMPGRLEAGTPNEPGLAGLAAALAWHGENGAEFRCRSQEAGRLLREGLRSIAKVRLLDDGPEAERISVVSFVVREWPVDEAGIALLESFGVMCRTGLHCAPLIHEGLGSAAEGTIRLSASGFNTRAEIQAAVTAIRRLAG
ncbi:MAG TPA: aminotransferase class V-fold PLP-dependent enzyme [Bryobacteraceae bacterium]|nr:aminotransferase class V-fold PLP-dependent enzyme [Bryobacteraceae bacterium]